MLQEEEKNDIGPKTDLLEASRNPTFSHVSFVSVLCLQKIAFSILNVVMLWRSLNIKGETNKNSSVIITTGTLTRVCHEKEKRFLNYCHP